MKKVLVSALMLCGLGNAAWAEETTSTSRVGGVLGGAWTVGGDSLVEYELEYDDGDREKDEIKAGEQFLLFGGLYYENVTAPDRAWGAQFNLGWFFNYISADNGDVSLTRFPLEVIPYARINKLRLGLGLTHHTSIELDDDALLNTSVEFEDATGLVVIAEYMVSDKVGLGLRYVDIDYDLDLGYYKETFDAGHVGFGVTVLF